MAGEGIISAFCNAFDIGATAFDSYLCWGQDIRMVTCLIL